jgi:hypothetical protein
MGKRVLIFIFAALGCFSSLSGQEIVLPLEYNPQKGDDSGKVEQSKSLTRTLTLPFWDDFSHKGPYPDQNKWADNYVFISTSMAVHPKTAGTATFDALDQSGKLYEQAMPDNTPFVADRLTSHPIRLDSVFQPSPVRLNPTDSVMLSFYFQPQGKGGTPRLQDSLILQFLHTPGHYIPDPDNGGQIWIDDKWNTVWKAGGQSLSAFAKDTFPYFHRVIIPITDPLYFRDNFRFRFVNHVSFPAAAKNPPDNTGGLSSWHIDYVWLDHGRNRNDSSYYDLAFAGPAQSLLRRYTSMPWSHYIINPQQHLRNNFSVTISNLNNIGHNYTYWYFIQDENGNNLRNYSGGSWNIAPFHTAGYQTYQPHANPIVVDNPLPTAPAEKRQFRIMHVLREGAAGDRYRRNDTLVYNQVFHNYFAFDDGVPESSYSLIGYNPKMALRFVASKPDTLKAVQLLFNRVLGEQNANQAFRITVWKRLFPAEEILYQSDEVVFARFEEGLHNFASYLLRENVLVEDTFYVGITQDGTVGDRRFLYLGFDKDNDASDHLFIRYETNWEPSIRKGAPMIRPFFGIPATTGIRSPEKKHNSLSLFPNPVTGSMIYLNPEELSHAREEYLIEVFDLHGRRIISQPYQNELNVGFMKSGIYLLRLIHPSGLPPHTTRFIIAR